MKVSFYNQRHFTSDLFSSDLMSTRKRKFDTEENCKVKYHEARKIKVLKFVCRNVIPHRAYIALYINATSIGFQISLKTTMKEKSALRNLTFLLFIGSMTFEVSGKSISHTKSYFGVSMVQLKLKFLLITFLHCTLERWSDLCNLTKTKQKYWSGQVP